MWVKTRSGGGAEVSNRFRVEYFGRRPGKKWFDATRVKRVRFLLWGEPGWLDSRCLAGLARLALAWLALAWLALAWLAGLACVALPGWLGLPWLASPRLVSCLGSSFQNSTDRSEWKNTSQGLKPNLFSAAYGTTEVMP